MRFRRMLVVVALLVAAPRLAHAEDDLKAARAKYERGMREFHLQQWDEALKDFQAAYFAHPDPAFLFNIAQCQRQLAQYDAAAKSYRLYLAQSPDSPNAAQIRKLVEQMDAASREEHAKAPPASTQPPLLTPPPATASATPPASPAATTLTSEAPPHASARPWYRSPVGWSLAGGGAAVAIVGGVMLGLAGSEGASASSATTQASFDQHHGRDLTDQQVGWPLVGVGVVAVAVGAVVMTVEARRHR